MKTLKLIPLFAILMTGGGAYAQGTLIADTCFPIERAFDILKSSSLQPTRRDSVDSFLEAYFIGPETRESAMQLYLQHDGTRDDFVVSKNGEVKGFHPKVLSAPDDTMICGQTRQDGKIGLGMSTSVRFKSSSGLHTMAEISDGVKDGKSHHKKNLGGAKALFVPKMTHIAIIYEAPDVAPEVSAIASGESVRVTLEPYGEMWVIDVALLEDSKVETITIGGGP